MSFELFRTVLIMSLSGSALALPLFASRPLVRRRLTKAAQYHLWFVVFAALLVPVSKLVVLPASAAVTPAISGAVERYVVSPAEIMARIESYQAVNSDGSVGVPDEYMPIVEEFAPEAWVQETFDWCRGLYPIGVMGCMAYFYFAYYGFVLKLKRRNRAANADETALLAALRKNRRVPKLYRNPLAATPMLIGLFRPALVLPDRDYTDAQLRAVLLHELTHLRRKDVLVKWLSVLACAVHWFNPIVWLARRALDRACELSCDEAVIAGLDAEGKKTYGDTLIAVAADSKTPRAVLSTTMCEEKKALKERLGAIMKNRKRTRAAIAASAALILLLAGCAAVLGAGNGEREPEPVPEPTPAATQPEAAPEPTPAPALYELDGFAAAIPGEYTDQIKVVLDDGYFGGALAVYEKASLEAGEKDGIEGVGFLFSVSRVTRAQYEQFLDSDGSGERYFAKDDTYYYRSFAATDVQFYPGGGGAITEADAAPFYALLSELGGAVQADIIARNGLTPYSDSEFWDLEFTYDSEHQYVNYYPYAGYTGSRETAYTLVLSQPARQGEGGVWCVERWYQDNGNLHYYFPDTGVPAAEYYAALQDSADAAAYLTPEGAAVAFAKEYFGHAGIMENSVDPATARRGG
ncbi:MAG: M56 family metallopeptidase [Oscillospiraceae bacterium]|jgi:beta-lactamase regulating signal transducer with metallopeptidase domain|nr:M56 family metallopeptidase [Oscillospiraceae bacterium]